jgi:hypothetical protein
MRIFLVNQINLNEDTNDFWCWRLNRCFIIFCFKLSFIDVFLLFRCADVKNKLKKTKKKHYFNEIKFEKVKH